MADIKPDDRPDLKAWKIRAELRRSSAASLIPSGKVFRRQVKHRKRGLSVV